MMAVTKGTHSHDGQSYKQISNAPTSNGQTSSMQKGNAAPSAKPSSGKASVGVSKASNSLVNTSSTKLPVANSKSPSLGDKPKHLWEQKKSINVKEEPKSIEHCAKDYIEDSEDDEDNKPLSVRMKNSNHDNRVIPIVVKKFAEDSDDDDYVPLSKKLFRNSNLGTTSSKRGDSDQKKPIPKIQKERQNGSSSSIKQDRPSPLPVKRPLDNSNSLHPYVKKPKVSDPAASIKTKSVSVKHLVKVEDEDDVDIPISQRMKKLVQAGVKSSSTKKAITEVTKVNKCSSKPFKRQVNKTFKKSGGSTEGGVIFPPPYQPHGVKMLYKGKPVYLTAEQEKVATMYVAMRDTEYMQTDRFKKKIWNDWRKLLGRNHVIKNLKDCDFSPIYDWYQSEKEKQKQMATEDIALLLLNFAANPKVEYFVEELDDDQPFKPEDLGDRVDILQEQLHALQDDLCEERRLRIQAYDELYRLLHKR